MYKGKSFVYFIITLTMMSMMGLLASDVYIPGLHDLTISLHATRHQVQQTIGVYLLGLAVFQLIYGPLSDHFGRKPVLLCGFIIYTVASFQCAVVTSIHQLMIWRFIQSCGACSGLVVGRAVISDLYSVDESHKIYNIIYPLVAASPAIAPFIGGYLISWFHWPATFIFVGFFGLLLIMMTIFHLKESKDKAGRTDFHVLATLKGYLIVICDYQYWSYLVAVFTLYGAWFIFLTQSTFTYSTIGYSASEIGHFYIPLVLSYIVSSIFCKRFLKTGSKESIFKIGLACFFVGALIMVVMTQCTTIHAAWQLIAPMCIVVFSNGIILPVGISTAVGLKPNYSGSASAVLGFFQIGFPSFCTSFFGQWFGVSSTSMAIEILSLSLVATSFYFILKRCHGRSR